MRVSLVYHSQAGGGVPADDLRRMIEAAGHRLLDARDTAESGGPTWRADADVVAVAGGDGTVGRVVKELRGASAALAVLPLGTANNIATSLGIHGDPEALVRGWSSARRLPFDIGLVSGPWGERLFVESVGTGLLAQGIATMDAEAPHAEEGDRAAMLRKARCRHLVVLEGMPPRRCVVIGNGQQIDAELLLVEVLNIRSVGPGLLLAPAVDFGDGLLDVVTADVSQRDVVARFLRAESKALQLPIWRAAEVTLLGADMVHVDDWVCRDVARRPVTVRAVRAAVQVLVG